MTSEMKSIIYRGGIVSFQIPANWKEEYERDGGGTFYEDIPDPDTGTLRLNVLSFEKKETLTVEAAAHGIFGGQTPELLPGGLPMRRYVKNATERGTALLLYRWEVLIPVPPNRWRLACFTHTVLAARNDDARTKAELEMIKRLLRTAEFSTQPEVVDAKPWWKFW